MFRLTPYDSPESLAETFPTLDSARAAASVALQPWMQAGDRLRFVSYSATGFPLLAIVFDSVGQSTDAQAVIDVA